ncbi:MAG TPA: ABC transporter ATP-binding protein [Vicinamibacterales bacterium]|nr:ABC transporter ATP-binding protein [Vicinamibacterales bacterium]
MSVDFDRVELSEVSRHFGRRRAVTRVSFVARSGEILGLLGPNGAGKSTLIGMLATLVLPSSGTIRYGAQSAADGGTALRSRIGLLAHDLHLYSDLTARQNLEFFAALYHLRPQPVVNAALQSAGLDDRADDAVSGFSRGMRQRLSLERALLHQPRLLLLDEPFTGLDDRSTTVVMERLRQLAASGTIVILATHDLDLADGLITRIAVVRDGKLICDETAAGGGLRDRYRRLVGHA